MKKSAIMILAMLIVNTAWANVIISSNVKNPFINEIIDISVLVPGTDKQAPTQLIIDSLDYKIIEKQISEIFSFNDETDETDKTECSIEYQISLILMKPGQTKIKYKVENNISDELILSIRPLNLSSQNLPKLLNVISDETLYVGENGYLANYLFSENYIDADYIRPFINLNINQLDSYYKRNIYIDKIKGQYKVVSAFSFNSNIPGSYQIPESQIISNDKSFLVPSYNIHVKQLPNNVITDSIIGKSLRVEIKGLPTLSKNGDNINFSIEIIGDANLSNITSLKNYINFPEFLIESLEYREDLFRDGEIINHLKFRYKGRLNSFIGFSIKNIKIPFFNTQLEEFQFVTIPNSNTSGNIPVLLLYSLIIIVFIIIVIILVFTIKFIKKDPKLLLSNDTKLSEQFNLSKRETEIYIILVNGKTTKEIADELSISPETVKKHIQNILKKTNTNSRLELLALINTMK